MDIVCMELIKPSLIKVFAEKRLNLGSDIEEDEADCTAICELLAWKTSSTLQRKQAWAADKNLRPVHVFSVHIAQYPVSNFSNTDIFWQD